MTDDLAYCGHKLVKPNSKFLKLPQSHIHQPRNMARIHAFMRRNSGRAIHRPAASSSNTDSPHHHGAIVSVERSSFEQEARLKSRARIARSPQAHAELLSAWPSTGKYIVQKRPSTSALLRSKGVPLTSPAASRPNRSRGSRRCCLECRLRLPLRR